jgi:hypothetical protein
MWTKHRCVIFCQKKISDIFGHSCLILSVPHLVVIPGRAVNFAARLDDLPVVYSRVGRQTAQCLGSRRPLIISHQPRSVSGGQTFLYFVNVNYKKDS